MLVSSYMSCGFIHCLIFLGWGGLLVIYSQLTTLCVYVCVCAGVCMCVCIRFRSQRGSSNKAQSSPVFPTPLWREVELHYSTEKRNVWNLWETCVLSRNERDNCPSNGHHLPPLMSSYCNGICAMNKIWRRCCSYTLSWPCRHCGISVLLKPWWSFLG